MFLFWVRWYVWLTQFRCHYTKVRNQFVSEHPWNSEILLLIWCKNKTWITATVTEESVLVKTVPFRVTEGVGTPAASVSYPVIALCGLRHVPILTQHQSPHPVSKLLAPLHMQPTRQKQCWSWPKIFKHSLLLLGFCVSLQGTDPRASAVPLIPWRPRPLFVTFHLLFLININHSLFFPINFVPNSPLRDIGLFGLAYAEILRRYPNCTFLKLEKSISMQI